MIFKNNKEIESLYKGSTTISEVYRGAVLLWQAIKSCFGKGFWINEKEWNNTDGWRNIK